ncbi:hypothetical protein KKD37_00125 [Patescibacteria group bacterium]|nr:hypothetical protein [Patescibacteria group bacterium]
MSKDVEVRVLSAAHFLLNYFMWLLLFLFFAKPVFAQGSPDLYTQYRNDYLYQRDQYQQFYDDYLNKKDIYTKYASVTAEKDKILAAKNVFLSQNIMLKSYLMTLRTILQESPDNQAEIQKYENWLSTQNQLIPSLNTTASVKVWSTTFEKQYIAIQTTLYTGLVQSQINRRLKTLDEIKKLADQAGVEWSSSFSLKQGEINKYFELAIDACHQNQRRDQFSNFYPEAKKYLDSADTNMKSLIADLKSIIIKNNN